MGTFDVRAATDPAEIRRFMGHVLRDLEALEIMLAGGLIERDVQRVGVEQELCMVDRYWRPAPLVDEVLAALDDPHATTELARFNIEFNLPPVPFGGDCLSRMEAQLSEKLARLREIMRGYEGEVLLTGILPTIRSMDLHLDNLCSRDRYKLLFKSLRKLRGGPFDYHIRGIDELISRQEYPTFEFANNAFQVHLQTHPGNFVNRYNFAKLITAPVLAAAVNSPMLVGKRLWQETRIAVFQQAIDTRGGSWEIRENRPRVSFPRQWISHSILEIFRDDVARFRPLLVADGGEDALQVLADGGIPHLRALTVFSGTVYRWNRACYGTVAGKPHLRIENRYLPSGPSVVDEVANAAFWLGLMNGITAAYEDLPSKISFDCVLDNFVRAARMGLDATFTWLDGRPVSAPELILTELLPLARSGLERAGIDTPDIDRFLTILRKRVESQRTGASWLLRNFAGLQPSGNANEALVALTAAMAARQHDGIPVHEWPPAELREAGDWINTFGQVGQFMTTELFTVQEEDLVDLVVNIMHWKNIHHVPVETLNGRLVGLISAGAMINRPRPPDGSTACAREVMEPAPVTVAPDTPTLEAIELMNRHHVDCLPVVQDGKLVGIVTENDFVHVARRLLKELQRRRDEGRSGG